MLRASRRLLSYSKKEQALNAGLRRKPIRETSFHPVLASLTLSQTSLVTESIESGKTPLIVRQNIDTKTALDTLSPYTLVYNQDQTKLAGILTHRDVIRKTKLATDLTKVSVHEVMTPNPKTLRVSHSLDETVESFFKGNFRHLPICPEDSDLPVVVLGINQCLKELFRFQVLHQYHKASKQLLKPLANPNFIRISTETNLQETVSLMNSADVGTLVVFEEQGGKKMFKGLVSEWDIVTSVAVKAVGLDQPVKDVMTSAKKVVGIGEKKNLLQGLERLLTTNHRHIPLFGEVEGEDSEDIIAEDGQKVSGLLSSKHVVKYVYQI